jgi:RNA polymerase sigma factor (sigma-70 family)
MKDAGKSRNQPLDQISTHWNDLVKAHAESGCAAREVRHAMVLRYLPAVEKYVLAMVGNPQDAQDLAQEIALRMLKGSFAGAQPERGRFRDYLKAAIRNVVRDFWDRQKRSVSLPLDELDDGAPSEDPWKGIWRQALLQRVWYALSIYQQQRPGSIPGTVLHLYLDQPEEDSASLARRLAESTGRAFTAESARQQLHRARKKFAQLLIEEITNSLENPTPERIEAELAELGLAGYLQGD